MIEVLGWTFLIFGGAVGVGYATLLTLLVVRGNIEDVPSALWYAAFVAAGWIALTLWLSPIGLTVHMD